MIEQKDLGFHLIKIITLNTFSLCRCLQLVKRFLVVVVFQDTCTLTWPQFMRYSLLVGEFYQSDLTDIDMFFPY